MDHVKIGEIELPIDYFDLTPEEKRDMCYGLIEIMLDLLNKQVPTYVSKFELLHKLLESSLITNTEEENYEICEILKNCQEILNEQTN